MAESQTAGTAAAAAAGPAKEQPAKEQKPRKRRRLKVSHPERCIGCLGCMFACSRIHSGNASLQDSAIKVQTQGGIEGDFRRGCLPGLQGPALREGLPCGGAGAEGRTGMWSSTRNNAQAAANARRPA